jgi:hypothetical protein
MSYIRYKQYRVPLPRSRWVRLTLGVFLMLGGLISILPIFGFWMLPVGLILISYDIPMVRRWRRRSEVVGLRWWRRHENDRGLSHLKRATLAFFSWPFLLIYYAKSWGRSVRHRLAWYRNGRANPRRRRQRRKQQQTVDQQTHSPTQHIKHPT